MTTVTVPASTEQIGYADLYARWEKGNWRATEIDFSQDRIDWHERLTERAAPRRAVDLHALLPRRGRPSPTNLSPYIDAAPLEEQKYFLATQQVDEARHTVFFKRFMHEVVGIGDGRAPAACWPPPPTSSTWGHRKVFGRLDEMADELRQDRSPAAARQGGDALPRRHRGAPRAVRPAHHRALPRGARRPARLPRGHPQRLARRAAPHRLRRALLADLYREDPEPIQRRDRRDDPRGPAWTTATGVPPDRARLPRRRASPRSTSTRRARGRSEARHPGDRPRARGDPGASRYPSTSRRASAPRAA